jgi:hypothetical protein
MMQGAALIYRPWKTHEGELIGFAAAPTLKFLQTAVGGHIELVPYFTTVYVKTPELTLVDCIAYCNEEGKLKGLEVNGIATVLWDRALKRHRNSDGELMFPGGLIAADGGVKDMLFGPVVVLYGDAEFMEAL